MVNKFNEVAQLNNWHFEYGRTDFNNLYNSTDKKEFKLFLDPLQLNYFYSEVGNVEKVLYSGRFMLLKHSDLGQVYYTQQGNEASEGRYRANIEPCKEQVKKMATAFSCMGLTIKLWQITEVINIFSDNLDGVLISFEILKEGQECEEDGILAASETAYDPNKYEIKIYNATTNELFSSEREEIQALENETFGIRIETSHPVGEPSFYVQKNLFKGDDFLRSEYLFNNEGNPNQTFTHQWGGEEDMLWFEVRSGYVGDKSVIFHKKTMEVPEAEHTENSESSESSENTTNSEEQTNYTFYSAEEGTPEQRGFYEITDLHTGKKVTDTLTHKNGKLNFRVSAYDTSIYMFLAGNMWGSVTGNTEYVISENTEYLDKEHRVQTGDIFTWENQGIWENGKLIPVYVKLKIAEFTDTQTTDAITQEEPQERPLTSEEMELEEEAKKMMERRKITYGLQISVEGVSELEKADREYTNYSLYDYLEGDTAVLVLNHPTLNINDFSLDLYSDVYDMTTGKALGGGRYEVKNTFGAFQGTITYNGEMVGDVTLNFSVPNLKPNEIEFTQ